MGDVFVYSVKLPNGIEEMVVPCCDGHTIYLDERLDDARRDRAYRHALEHIRRDDWMKEDVQEIEISISRKTGA